MYVLEVVERGSFQSGTLRRVISSSQSYISEVSCSIVTILGEGMHQWEYFPVSLVLPKLVLVICRDFFDT